MEAPDITFEAFQEKHKKDEGIVLLGCDEAQSWINGVCGLLHDEEMIPSAEPESAFTHAYQLTTTGGRLDVVLVFDKKAKIEIGKMAMWRLRFGDCSWISDYLVNYKDQHVEELRVGTESN